jgi:hypothetical protein
MASTQRHRAAIQTIVPFETETYGEEGLDHLCIGARIIDTSSSVKPPLPASASII